MAQHARSEAFANLPVKQAVLKQIVPTVASQMIALVYNLADTYFVGLLNDPNQTAAITIVTPAFLILTVFSNLFGVGGANAIARALGKNEPDQIKHISALSFWGGTLIAFLFSLLFLVLGRPILTLCGMKTATETLAMGYARWVVIIGGPVTILNALLANLVRAEGGANCAFFGVSFGGLLNIVLDPLFVLPQFLGMGAVGAGIATAISNAAATVFFLLYLVCRRSSTVLRISPRHLKGARPYVQPVLSVGFPSALQHALTVVAASAQTNFVSKYSTEAIAALGIVKKMDQLPLFFSLGVANGMLPLLAYNHAAGNHIRRKESFWFGTLISLSFSLLCLVAYELFAPQLTALFIDDAVTITYASGFLRRLVIGMPLMAVCYTMIIQFQATGRVREALIASILRKGLLDIPLLFLMDALQPLYGCMWVQPMVDSISLVVVILFYRKMQKDILRQSSY